MQVATRDASDRRGGDDGADGAARAIAGLLAEAAVWSRGACGFHGAGAPAAEGLPAVQRSFAGGAYDGSAGVARFLALAARLGDDDRLAAVARGAMAHAVARFEGWSLFTGGAGVALIGWEVAAWLDEPGPAHESARMLTDAASAALHVGDRAPADLLGGIAGVVLALVTALDAADAGAIRVRRADVERWESAALELGGRLLATAEPTPPRAADGFPRGLAWPLEPGGRLRLCGLAHGASGAALALEALAARVPDPVRWREAAQAARRFERTWYSVVERSWADLRSDPPSHPHLWCHGSVGIAAERLGADASDELARSDLVAGLAGATAMAGVLSTAPVGPAAGDAVNGSQCHGLGGLSDLFVSAWRVDHDPGWLELARSCVRQTRRDALRPEGWRCGVTGGGSTPGLMLGLAGIGWAQLRAAHPERVPSAWRLGSGVTEAAGWAGPSATP